MPVVIAQSPPALNRYIEAPIATAKAIDDFYAVAQTSGTVTLPSDETWDTNLATTQANFVAKYLGQADQLKVANVARIPGNMQDNIIRVVSDGLYLVTVESAAFVIGESVGPSKASGNALVDTSFVKAVAASSCLRCVKGSAGVAVTSVLCRVMSTLAPNAKQ
jgi:hypothetical protein